MNRVQGKICIVTGAALGIGDARYWHVDVADEAAVKAAIDEGTWSLACAESRFVTGSELIIDGGHTAR